MNTKSTRFITSKMTAFLATALVAGCADVATFQQIDQHDQQNLRGVSWKEQYRELKIKHPQAAINKPVDLCEQRDVLYVKMHNHSSLSSAYFEDAVMVTLENNQLFRKIATRQPTVYVNVDPYSPSELPDGRMWYDTDDPLTIGKIQRMYPEPGLLILEVQLQEFAKDEPIVVSLNLIDPTDGATIVYWRDARSVWYRSMDMPTVALVDSFNHWVDNVAKMCEEEIEYKKVEIEIAADNAEVEIEVHHSDVEVEIKAEHKKAEQPVKKKKVETKPHKTEHSGSVLAPTIVQ